MHKIAKRIAYCLVDNDIIIEEQKEEYAYGIEVFGLKVINYGTILIVAIILKILLPTLLFLVSYVGLRGRTGGYHSKSAIRCYFGTVTIYMGVVLGAEKVFINHFLMLFILSIISVACILIFAPVNNKRLHLSVNEWNICRKKSCVYAVSALISVGMFRVIGINLVYISYFLLGIILDASLLLVEIIKERGYQSEEGVEKKCT